MMVRTHTLRLALLVTSAALAVGAGCPGDETIDDLSEDEVVALCEDVMVVYCEKAFECAPALAPLALGVGDASQCRVVAEEECRPDDEDDDGEDDCVIEEYPTEGEVRQCADEIDASSCEEIWDVAEAGVCADVSQKLECDEGADGDADADADGDGDADSDGDADGDGDVVIETAGCVAAVAATCESAAVCAESYPRLPPSITAALGSCDATVEARSAELEAACEEYLSTGVAMGYALPVYLNGADPATVEACIDGQSCDRDYVVELMTAFIAFSEGSTSSADLGALLSPLLEGCY